MFWHIIKIHLLSASISEPFLFWYFSLSSTATVFSTKYHTGIQSWLSSEGNPVGTAIIIIIIIIIKLKSTFIAWMYISPGGSRMKVCEKCCCFAMPVGVSIKNKTQESKYSSSNLRVSHYSYSRGGKIKDCFRKNATFS